MSEKQKVAAFVTGRNGGKMTQMIIDTIKAIGIDGRIEVVEVPRMRQLEDALKKAIDMITSEYCSHGAHAGAKERNEVECGPDNPRCYAQEFYKLLERKPIAVDERL